MDWFSQLEDVVRRHNVVECLPCPELSCEQKRLFVVRRTVLKVYRTIDGLIRPSPSLPVRFRRHWREIYRIEICELMRTNEARLSAADNSTKIDFFAKAVAIGWGAIATTRRELLLPNGLIELTDVSIANLAERNAWEIKVVQGNGLHQLLHQLFGPNPRSSLSWGPLCSDILFKNELYPNISESGSETNTLVGSWLQDYLTTIRANYEGPFQADLQDYMHRKCGLYILPLFEISARQVKLLPVRNNKLRVWLFDIDVDDGVQGHNVAADVRAASAHQIESVPVIDEQLNRNLIQSRPYSSSESSVIWTQMNDRAENEGLMQRAEQVTVVLEGRRQEGEGRERGPQAVIQKFRRQKRAGGSRRLRRRQNQ